MATDRKAGRLVLQFGDDALRELLADARRLFDRRPITECHRFREFLRRHDAEDAQRDLRADALDRLQRAEPAPLEFALKSEKPDRVLAHVRIDGQRDSSPGFRLRSVREDACTS